MGIAFARALATAALAITLLCPAPLRAATELPAGTIPAIPDSLFPSIPPLDIGQYMPNAAFKGILITLAALTQHRAYRGLGPLGKGTVEFGIEATLTGIPQVFHEGMASITGSGSGQLGLGSLPMGKLHLSRGFSDKVDVGISGLYYLKNYMLGVDIQGILLVPEEGVKWGWRIGYSETYIDLSELGIKKFQIKSSNMNLGEVSLIVKSRAITPQLLLSKPLGWTEPYLGLGLEWLEGQIEIPIRLSVETASQKIVTPNYRSIGYTAFMGFNLRMPLVGLLMAVEGGYGSLGTHHLGVVLGLNF